MAALSITAANVKAGSNARVVHGVLGGTITAGQPVYLGANNKYLLADADASALTADVKGIALNGGSEDQPVAVHVAGDIAIGATVTVGEIYVLDGTAGGICPEADLASGDWVTVIGVGKSTSVIDVRIHAVGVQIPA